MASVNRMITVLLALGPIAVAAPTIAAPRQQSPMERLINLFKPRSHPSGTRGALCLITPGYADTRTVWSDRPLFLWREDAGRIVVQQAETNTVVWSQSLSTNQHSTVYQGKPLQSGQTYEIVFFDEAGQPIVTDADFNPKFTMLEAAEQTRIAAALSTEEKQLKAQKATPETIALHRAIYFSQQNLWSDALQEIYLLPQKSSQLTQFIQSASAEACGE